MSVADFLKPDEWLDTSPRPRYARLQKHIKAGIETV